MTLYKLYQIKWMHPTLIRNIQAKDRDAASQKSDKIMMELTNNGHIKAKFELRLKSDHPATMGQYIPFHTMTYGGIRTKRIYFLNPFTIIMLVFGFLGGYFIELNISHGIGEGILFYIISVWISALFLTSEKWGNK